MIDVGWFLYALKRLPWLSNVLISELLFVTLIGVWGASVPYHLTWHYLAPEAPEIEKLKVKTYVS
jgi:hypothetical protein